jgi:transcriptional regulator of met regulon
MQDREAINTHVQKLKRNQVDIRRRHMDVTVLLVKAFSGGWTAAPLPKLNEFVHSSTDDVLQRIAMKGRRC